MNAVNHMFYLRSLWSRDFTSYCHRKGIHISKRRSWKTVTVSDTTHPYGFLHWWPMWVASHNIMTMRSDIVERKFRHHPSVRNARRGWERTSDKVWWNSYAASSTTVAKKNSVLLSLEMTTTGSRGVSSSSSLLPEAVFVGSSIPGATKAAAPSAVSANLATEYPLRDLSQKPLEKPLHLSCTSLFIRHLPALIQQVAYLSCTKRRHAFWQHLQDPEWQSVAVSFLRRTSQTSL